ncbi:DUF3040 domain-containing protein [Arthrobacter sp. I2-34]|uniref:DUF3040 domain-containing protein n=1 Tax=Arthrobacter hankyongi TaxID=2904801 RepID=A0ABS9L7A0_9MICC|nr:DUF3040 domain-containing protein [Arthrobacter hankyongi]MCG2622542.1 DUF3040 domain-containing protein [Arthrobacter hankyongi]
MPLTDEERKRLEQLERELSLEDPEFAQKLRRGLVVGPSVPGLWDLVLLVTGILILLAGVAMQFILVGVIGFLLMGAGAYRLSGQPQPSKALRR